MQIPEEEKNSTRFETQRRLYWHGNSEDFERPALFQLKSELTFTIEIISFLENGLKSHGIVRTNALYLAIYSGFSSEKLFSIIKLLGHVGVAFDRSTFQTIVLTYTFISIERQCHNFKKLNGRWNRVISLGDLLLHSVKVSLKIFVV